jgi:hypothetical protein
MVSIRYFCVSTHYAWPYQVSIASPKSMANTNADVATQSSCPQRNVLL